MKNQITLPHSVQHQNLQMMKNFLDLATHSSVHAGQMNIQPTPHRASLRHLQPPFFSGVIRADTAQGRLAIQLASKLSRMRISRPMKLYRTKEPNRGIRQRGKQAALIRPDRILNSTGLPRGV